MRTRDGRECVVAVEVYCDDESNVWATDTVEGVESREYATGGANGPREDAAVMALAAYEAYWVSTGILGGTAYPVPDVPAEFIARNLIEAIQKVFPGV